MRHRCERCNEEWGEVSFRNEDVLPENVKPGYYCEDCLKALKAAWWKLESTAYIFDNDGNRADSLDFDPDNYQLEKDSLITFGYFS